MIIRIKRIYGNADFTIGIATIDGFKFRAYSLERRSADHSRAANKRNNHAFPCGEYKYKYEVTRLSPMTPVSYLLKGYGRISIKDASSFDMLGTGQIALFHKYPQEGHAVAGAEDNRIYKALENLCYADSANKTNGENLFVITEADEFYYDEAWVMQHEPLFEDDDFLDDFIVPSDEVPQ